jgi:hypothetical protein
MWAQSDKEDMMCMESNWQFFVTLVLRQPINMHYEIYSILNLNKA